MRNRVIWLACITAAAGLVGFWVHRSSSARYAGADLGTPGSSSSNSVFMFYTSFSPPRLIVAKGTTVTWKNDDELAHAPTSDTGVWDLGDIPSGGSKSITFDSAGTFKYHCSTHPYMTGTIVVQ